MHKISQKTQALFKKAYHYNWDNGVLGLKPILADSACDRATALLIFWMGSPAYFYNHAAPKTMRPDEVKQFNFLKSVAVDLLADKYPVAISYAVDPALLPAELGLIPAALALPVHGHMPYMDILQPNTNPFQDQVLARCQHCTQVADMYALEAQGADFSRKILHGYALPIVVAVNHGQVEAVQYFIEQGYDLNMKDNKVPLVFNAAISQNIDLVQRMLDHGAKVQEKGPQGKTVLHAIAEMSTSDGFWGPRMEDIVRLLVKSGASPQALNARKLTPAALARELGQSACAEFLESL